jgi:hypothetical protein
VAEAEEEITGLENLAFGLVREQLIDRRATIREGWWS